MKVSIGLYILELRDIQQKLLSLPTYGLHTEINFTKSNEISSQFVLQDPKLKYVLIPCIEQIDKDIECEFELILLTPSKENKFNCKRCKRF